MTSLRRTNRQSPERDEEGEEGLPLTSSAGTHQDHGSLQQTVLRQRHRLRIWMARRPRTQWTVLCLFLGIGLVYNIVFHIRYFTMSRPSWIYGSPMDAQEVELCILPSVEIKATSVQYDWFEHQQNRTKHTSSQRLLVAQFSGYGTYAKLLDVVAPINAKYANDWGHDYVVLQGTAMKFGSINPKCPDEHRSTFNKIPLLQLAYDERDRYDMVLILDTDAMIVNFQFDITTLLPSTHLLAAHRVWSYDWRNTWDINAGITLWNLHHASLPRVLNDWARSVQSNPYLVLERNDDQYFLQAVLLNLGFWKRWVYSLTREFQYYDATVIKHFKRDARSWSTTSLDQRLLRIQEVIQELNGNHNVERDIIREIGLKFSERTREGGRLAMGSSATR